MRRILRDLLGRDGRPGSRCEHNAHGVAGGWTERPGQSHGSRFPEGRLIAAGAIMPSLKNSTLSSAKAIKPGPDSHPVLVALRAFQPLHQVVP